MEKIIFIFSTPEGGGKEIEEYLSQECGFKINSNCNNLLWRVHSLLGETRTGQLGDGTASFLKNMLFSQPDFSDFWGAKDEHMGKNFGFGLRMWSFLKVNIPTAKFIFSCLPLEKNIAKVAANSKHWVPHYGSCLSNCEQRIKIQIKQFDHFAEFYRNDTLYFRNSEVDKAKIKEFLEL